MTIKNEIKKEKEQKNTLVQEIKELKSKAMEDVAASEKNNKELNDKIKELNSKIAAEEKNKNQLITKQKSQITEINTLKAEN